LVTNTLFWSNRRTCDEETSKCSVHSGEGEKKENWECKFSSSLDNLLNLIKWLHTVAHKKKEKNKEKRKKKTTNKNRAN